MYRFAICDDDTVFLDNAADLLGQVLQEDGIPFAFDTYTDTASLFEAIEQENKQYHVLLLDILMETENGVDFARRLREAGVRSSIIFITSCPDFALVSFEVNPVHYLLKPVNRQSLRVAVKRCMSPLQRNSCIVLNGSDKESQVVRLEDILYAEIFLTELKVHLKNGVVATGVGRMKEMLDQLPGTRFYQCHRSFVVNMEEVAGMRKFEFIMKNGQKVPIAQRKYSDAMRALSLYSG